MKLPIGNVRFVGAIIALLGPFVGHVKGGVVFFLVPVLRAGTHWPWTLPRPEGVRHANSRLPSLDRAVRRGGALVYSVCLRGVDGAQLRSVPSGGGSLHGQCVPRQEPGDEGARVLHLPRFGLAT